MGGAGGLAGRSGEAGSTFFVGRFGPADPAIGIGLDERGVGWEWSEVGVGLTGYGLVGIEWVGESGGASVEIIGLIGEAFDGVESGEGGEPGIWWEGPELAADAVRLELCVRLEFMRDFQQECGVGSQIDEETGDPGFFDGFGWMWPDVLSSVSGHECAVGEEVIQRLWCLVHGDDCGRGLG